MLPPLAALPPNHLVYALPLIVIVSLVYGATRHERTGEIVQHALRAGGWICGFMLAIFAVLFLISRHL